MELDWLEDCVRSQVLVHNERTVDMIYIYFQSVCEILDHHIRDLAIHSVEVENVKCFENMLHVILHLKEPLGIFKWLLNIVVPRYRALHIYFLLKERQVYRTLPLPLPACGVVPIITAVLVLEIVLPMRLPNVSFFGVLKYLFLFLCKLQARHGPS